MNDHKFDAVAFLSDDRVQIRYRPRLNMMTGGVLPTILLNEIVYWWYKMDRKPFYKFKEPPVWRKNSFGEEIRHPNYRDGDSWCEALGFSRREFDSALKKIGKKVRKGERLPEEALVWYWSDTSRRTWYRLNEELFRKGVYALYVTFGSAHTNLRKKPIDKNPTGPSSSTHHHNNEQARSCCFEAFSPDNSKSIGNDGKINWPSEISMNYRLTIAKQMAGMDSQIRALVLANLSDRIRRIECGKAKHIDNVYGFVDALVKRGLRGELIAPGGIHRVEKHSLDAEIELSRREKEARMIREKVNNSCHAEEKAKKLLAKIGEEEVLRRARSKLPPVIRPGITDPLHAAILLDE